MAQRGDASSRALAAASRRVPAMVSCERSMGTSAPAVDPHARIHTNRVPPGELVDVWGSGDTSDVKRILLGGSYAGAVAAGGVASAQLWLHAFTVDERSATRALAVP